MLHGARDDAGTVCCLITETDAALLALLLEFMNPGHINFNLMLIVVGLCGVDEDDFTSNAN